MVEKARENVTFNRYHSTQGVVAFIEALNKGSLMPDGYLDTLWHEHAEHPDVTFFKRFGYDPAS